MGERFSHLSTFFSLVTFLAFRDAPYSRFRCRDPNQYLRNFLKVLLLAHIQIYTRVFHLWKSIDLDSAWVKYTFPCQFSFLSRVLAGLEVRHTRVLDTGIPTNAPPNLHTSILLVKSLSSWTVLRFEYSRPD